MFLTSTSLDATEQMARILAAQISAGDCILLNGVVGAGKTAFARAIIQAFQAREGYSEHVPSPTFTLVQTYSFGEVEIWHADLYRLTDTDEVIELGLDEAIEAAICLIEWPELLGELRPDHALSVTLSPTGDETRVFHLEWSDPKWNSKLKSLSEFIKE